MKYDDVRRVTLVDLDPAMTGLAGTHPVLSRINGGSMLDPRVTVTNSDASLFLKESRDLYGVIIIDLPDPDSVDLMHVYSLGFYRMLKHHLPAGGVLVTQASSPYFSRDAFLCINKTITEAGFSTLPYHNQVPTMGEWGWVLGVRKEQMDSVRLKEAVLKLDFKSVTTRFINREAVASMANFGKGVFDSPGAGEIRYNSEINPVLFRYYARGSWGVY